MINDNINQTNRGLLLELFYNIAASEAGLCHDFETLILYQNELEEQEYVASMLKHENKSTKEIDDNIENINVKIENIKLLISNETEARRLKQELLERLSGTSLNNKFHCKIKHFSRVIEQDFELIESYMCDETINILKLDFKNLSLTLSLYLGIEYSDCYRCLLDKAKSIYKNK
jgi:hypothetical protein